MLKASIVIPTYGRESSLQKCLKSLNEQTVKPYEIVIERGKGELARIRNLGFNRTSGDVVCFIDDDVVCTPHWLESIIRVFDRKDIAGVSGPSIIDETHRNQRDIFKYRWIKKVYDLLFLDGKEKLPGHITTAGTWTTGATDEDCLYDGGVEYLEACNMSFRSSIFKFVKGFDEGFRGVGDWSEPDVALRIKRLGHKLWFSKDAKLYHNPSQTGPYGKRISDKYRLLNYYRFSDRWVKPHWKNSLYKRFLETYYTLKKVGLI